MKLCVVALLCCFAINLFAQPNKRPTKGKTARTNDAPCIITFNNNQEPEAHEATVQISPPHWYTALKRPDWWLVIVAALTAAFIAWQARETTRATKAMRDSLPFQQSAAQAALLNAQAVINAERAWVVAELHPMGKKRDNKHWVDDSGMPFTTAQILDSKHEEYSLRIKNIGRTPAQIISFEMSYSCLPEGVTQLPSSSPDATHVSDFEHLLANSDPIEILPPFNPGDYMKDSWLDIKALEKTAVFHGWVKYRHMLSDEDCWWDYCYVYTPSLDRLTAVGRYTKPRQKQQTPN